MSALILPAVNAITLSAKPDLTLTASQQRQQDPDFLARCATPALADQLPLRWPTPPQVPASPKPRYRSDYQPPNPARVQQLDEAAWQSLSLFDLVLLLVDFSGLRPVLASKLYRASECTHSARGRIPFDPISCFLLFGWQLVNRWKRLEALRQLAKERNADYREAFGFRSGVYPSESGYRYFLTVLGRKNLNDLIHQSMELVHASGVIPAEVLAHATVSFDGQIHDAASHLRCRKVQASCYQPTSPEQPRPCPAKEAGARGCDCDTTDCRLACKQATPWDPDARYVFYEQHNRSAHPTTCTPVAPISSAPAGSAPAAQSSSGKSDGKPDGKANSARPPRGEEHYGYRSLPESLIDPINRANWTLSEAPLASANTHEEDPAAKLLEQTVKDYDWLHVELAVGDAGLGYEVFLKTAARLHIRRVVDLRADPRTDGNKAEWAIRGYDYEGWAVCQFAYRFHPNGYDQQRHRYKWCCRQSCESPVRPGEAPPDSPPDCPYRNRVEHPYGRIVDVADTYKDKSYRLVRDVPYGSPSWKRIYRRARNAAEERNAQLEAWGLTRLPVFGTLRAQAAIFLADVWGNLITLARLIKEATIAALTKPKAAT